MSEQRGVSIVVINYNCAKLLGRWPIALSVVIDSALGQVRIIA
jgi:hypothetical protein